MITRIFIPALMLIGMASAMPFKYARNVSLDSANGVPRLRIFVGRDTTTYALCPEGKCPQSVDSKTKIISVPLHRVICMSSVQSGFLEALDLRDRIVGVDQADFICDSALRALGKHGAWSQVGTDDRVDWERVMAVHPDALFFSFPPGGVSSMAPKADALHVPSIAVAEWMENHPLGRAEWLRVYGVLFGRERKADSLFATVQRRYDSLRTAVQIRKQRPSAIGGLGWRGQWFVSGGSSYMAQLLRDAGISYPWEGDHHTGSLTLGLEAVLEKGRNADVWLNPGEATSLADLLKQEPRASKFRSFREGRVYQHDAHRCPTGGNLYWETGVTRPDLLLSDLANIVEGKLDSHSGNYYRRLPQLSQLPQNDSPAK